MMNSSLRNHRVDTLPERIFLDASHTCASGKNSGIERVVRSIIAECGHWCQADGLPKPKIVTHEAGRFYCVENRVEDRFAHIASLEANIRCRLPKWYINLAEAICQRTKYSRLRRWFMPEAGHLGVFKLPHNLYDTFVRKGLSTCCDAVVPNRNDLFLLPDAYWTRRGVWEAAAQARRAGATIVTLIYDLIPLTHPQYVGTKRMEGFRRYLHKAIEHSDMIVAISRTVQHDVESYIRDHRSEFHRVPTDVQHFTLGAELNLVEGEVRPSVRELFAANPSVMNQKNPYLMVATFDPRKNHHYLLDAFDLLWKDHQDLRLCLIGRVGSLCEDVIQRIRNHPALNTQLFAFYDIKDAELQHCYQTCRGVIFPSIVEGFGLPIVESLWFGKRTFVSNTPIHREVGRNDCVYFDLDSPQSLATEIENWERTADLSANQLPTRRPTTWTESSRQLIACCLNAHRILKTEPDTVAGKAA